MPTRKTPRTDTPSESNPSGSQGRSTGFAKSGTPGVRDVMIRNLPDDAYETLRRLAFERETTYADIIADALRSESRKGRP